ncbi:MAG: stage II sporulation protein M [Anaerolineales bacterium]
MNLGLTRELPGTLLVAKREIRDQLRDWRILTPIIMLTLFFPLLMNYTARTALSFVEQYGATIIGERLIPFLLMVVGFFPISISLVIALESFAGERERLSLEPLLATPLTDTQLYFGKIFASLLAPIGAAYLGIFVYLAGLLWRLGWTPTPQLLAQILLLTATQALLMVTAAVVISTQTTSVRGANLLASFIIIPAAQLIIIESLIMFWGRYAVLWWIVAALLLVSVVLGRMGLHLFNREQLLGREFDNVDLKWGAGRFWDGFRGKARSPFIWYRETITRTLPEMRGALIIMTLAVAAAYIIGFRSASSFTLPEQLFVQERIASVFTDELSNFGFLSASGWAWIAFNNLRAVAIASVLGAFSLGIAAMLLLMAPVGIVGYLAGNIALAGADTSRLIMALVLPHGLIEIPAAIIAGAAILQLGLAALSLPKGSSLGASWLVALGKWARLLLALVIPMLLVAAALEVFVTPRVAVALLAGP